MMHRTDIADSWRRAAANRPARSRARGRAWLVALLIGLIPVAGIAQTSSMSGQVSMQGLVQGSMQGSARTGAAASATSAAVSGAAGLAVRPALSVAVVAPQPATLDERVSANGSVAAWQEASVGAEVNGLRLSEVNVNVGDTVRRGQVLAVFATDSVTIDLAQARAALAEAQVALLEAQGNAQRARAVRDSGALSEQQVAQLLAAEQSARARVDAVKAQLAAHELRLRKARVLAPDEGTISARAATVGAVVPQGSELFRLIRRDRVEWRAEVTAAELPRLRAGQAVQVSNAAGETVAGQVRVIAPTIDPQTRNALVYVDLPADARARGMRPGMFARGEFLIGQSPAMTVPMTALAMRDGFAWVYVLGAGDKVAQRKVRLGRRSGDRVEVVEGLRPDERVVASGAAFLADGDTVRVVSR